MKDAMKSLALILLALSLTGCATFKLADVRLACTVAKDEAMAIMDLGVMRIAPKVDDRDRQAVCK